MTVGEVPDAANTRWLRWHHERTPIVCPPTLLPSLLPSPEQSRSAPPGRSAAQGAGRLVVAKARGAFWHQLGAGREAGAGRVMASFSGFAFQSLIHFRIFSGWGVRIEEGAERGRRSGAFPPRAFRAAHGAPATAREARSAIGAPWGAGVRRGPGPPSSLGKRVCVWGGSVSQGAGRSAAPGQPASCLRLAAAQPAGPKAPAHRTGCREKRTGRASSFLAGGRSEGGF